MEIKEVAFLKSIVETEKEIFPLNEINLKKQILFLGRSNVWKSSMINSLLWKKLAHSSSTAWKTRSINIYKVNKDFQCLDFPGYWYAKVSKEDKKKLRDMILDYVEKNIAWNIKIVIILDSFVWPTDDDIEVFEYLKEKWANILIVLNKVDKPNQKELEKTKKMLAEKIWDIQYILYSSKKDIYRKNALTEIFDNF